MSNIINPQYSRYVYFKLLAPSVAAAAAMCAPFESIKIIALTALTGASHAFANAMFACRDCLGYFDTIADCPDCGRQNLGWKYGRPPNSNHHAAAQHTSENPPTYQILNTPDPNLHALIIGMMTVQCWSIPGLIFAVIARIPFSQFSPKITARQLAPYMIITAAITVLVTQVKTKRLQAAIKQNITSLQQQYPKVPKDLQLGWATCEHRISISLTNKFIWMAALIVAMIAGRAGLVKL